MFSVVPYILKKSDGQIHHCASNTLFATALSSNQLCLLTLGLEALGKWSL